MQPLCIMKITEVSKTASRLLLQFLSALMGWFVGGFLQTGFYTIHVWYGDFNIAKFISSFKSTILILCEVLAVSDWFDEFSPFSYLGMTAQT